MPKVKYTYSDGSDTFSEEDILPPGMDIQLRGKQMVMLWNERADAAGDPQRELRKAEIIDPFVHEHVWSVKISRTLTGNVDHVYCHNCPVEGTRRTDNGPVLRDPKFASDFYEQCREKKPQPKSKPRFS